MSTTKKVKSEEPKSKKIKVVAAPDFRYYRFAVLKGLTKKQYRDLQEGKAVEIEDKYFKPNLYEVKNGDN